MTNQQIMAVYNQCHKENDGACPTELVKKTAELLGIPYDDVKEAVIEDSVKFLGAG